MSTYLDSLIIVYQKNNIYIFSFLFRQRDMCILRDAHANLCSFLKWCIFWLVICPAAFWFIAIFCIIKLRYCFLANFRISFVKKTTDFFKTKSYFINNFFSSKCLSSTVGICYLMFSILGMCSWSVSLSSLVRHFILSL